MKPGNRTVQRERRALLGRCAILDVNDQAGVARGSNQAPRAKRAATEVTLRHESMTPAPYAQRSMWAFALRQRARWMP